MLPSEVTSLYLMLQQAFQTCLSARLALLIPSDSQDVFRWIWLTGHCLPTSDVDDVLMYFESEDDLVNQRLYIVCFIIQ